MQADEVWLLRELKVERDQLKAIERGLRRYSLRQRVGHEAPSREMPCVRMERAKNISYWELTNPSMLAETMRRLAPTEWLMLAPDHYPATARPVSRPEQ